MNLREVNAVIRHIQTDKLAIAAALWVVKEVRVKRRKRREKRAIVERRIESDIHSLRGDINSLERERQGKLAGKERERLSNLMLNIE